VKGHEASVVATDRTVTDGPYPESMEHLGGFRGRRRALTRGGAGVGGQDRRRVPLSARGAGAPARPDRLIKGASGDVAAAIGELRAEPGGELQVWGSGTLIRWLLDHRLVDEIVLLTYPVVVGQGTRLFPATRT